jgi:hypothetical protein
MTIDLKKTIPVLTGLIAIVAAIFAVDARYLQTARAGEIFTEQAKSREEGDLQTQLDLARLELQFWMKSDPSEERQFKVEYLRDKIGRIEERLRDIKGGK